MLGCCREAARKASAFAEDGTFIETKEALRLPGFEKVIGFAVQKALEDWRDEALEGNAACPFFCVGQIVASMLLFCQAVARSCISVRC